MEKAKVYFTDFRTHGTVHRWFGVDHSQVLPTTSVDRTDRHRSPQVEMY